MVCAAAQVLDRFEQRHHDEIDAGMLCILGRERPVQQACFFLQEQHFEQVADRLGMADDVVTDGIGSELLSQGARRLEHCQFAFSARRVGRIADPERPWLMQQGQQQRLLLLLVHLRVSRFDARGSQQLADDGLVAVRALAEIGGRKVKSENLSRANERAQPEADHRGAVMAAQRLSDSLEVRQKSLDARHKAARIPRDAGRPGYMSAL